MSLTELGHISASSTQQDTVTVMETTPANPVTPLGLFSRFPREIRDEIYRHILSKMYRPKYEPKVDDWFYVECKRNRRLTLSVLALSKTVKDEAMALLFSEATFCYVGQIDSRLPDIAITNRMRSIEILFYDSLGPKLDDDRKTANFCAVLGLFQGDTITRKSILITFKQRSCVTEMIMSPLLEALRELTGFKTVTLKLSSWDGFPPEAAGQRERCYVGFGPSLNAMRKYLEPSLGTSVMSDPAFRKDDFWSRQIMFHPQDYLAGVCKSEKDAVSTEQSMSTMQIN